MFHAHRITIEPTVGCCGLNHRVLAADVIGGYRHVDGGPGLGNHIEVGQRRLDHHHVGALLNVTKHLHHGLADVRRILLVSLPIAAVGDLDVDGVAKRPVERRGVLGGVGEDGRLLVASIVQGSADRRHLAVHHPRRGGDGGPGICLGHGSSGVQFECGVIVHRPVPIQHATVAMVGVLVHAQVGHQNHVVAHLVTKVTQGHLDDAVRVPGLGADGVLAVGYPEEDDGRDPQVTQCGHFGPQAGPGVLDDAGQRIHGLWIVDALADEQRGDQVVNRQAGLGDEAPHGGGTAQAARSRDEVVHDRSLRRQRPQPVSRLCHRRWPPMPRRHPPSQRPNVSRPPRHDARPTGPQQH